MKQAKSTFHVVSLNFHRCSTPTRSALNTNSRNSAPWIGPMVLTNAGWSNPYFSGTAIKTRTSRDKPSMKAQSLSRPMVVVKNVFMIKMFEDRACPTGAKMARE